MVCFPNVKINLGLSITGKREDGFHNISSIFFPLPFHDIIEITELTGEYEEKLYYIGPDLGIHWSKNLVWKTYSLLKEQFDLPPLAIHLLKKIPAGGGLGGGSADASFLINLIAKKYELPISMVKKEKLALEIGSDCPYFLHNTPMEVSGRGEVLKELEAPQWKLYTFLIFSDLSISTKKAYEGITPQTPSILPADVYQSPELWKTQLKNDFETPVYMKHPTLKKNIEAFYEAGALYASLTGTGGAQYALFTEKPQHLPLDLQQKVLWQGYIGNDE